MLSCCAETLSQSKSTLIMYKLLHRICLTISALCMQADVECEYGYERHNEECRPIYGLESAKCSVIDRDNYVVSETKHRLIEGDTCSGLAQIIADTDGKGNLPGGHHGRHPSHGRTGTTVFLVMLVRSMAYHGPLPETFQCVSVAAAICCHHCDLRRDSMRRLSS